MADKKTTKKTTPKKTVTKSSSSSKSSSVIPSGRFNLDVISPKTKKKLLIVIGIILVAALVYYFRGLFIVATVNGQPISRIALIQELESQSGQQSLDRLITKKLILQEAEKQSIDITSTEIDSEYADIESQFTDQGQELDQLLEIQGLSKEGFREELRIQLLVKKLLADEAAVTDAEFEDFLDSNSDLLEAEDNKEEARARFKDQLEQQKLATKYQEFVDALNQQADIKYLVDY